MRDTTESLVREHDAHLAILRILRTTLGLQAFASHNAVRPHEDFASQTYPYDQTRKQASAWIMSASISTKSGHESDKGAVGRERRPMLHIPNHSA